MANTYKTAGQSAPAANTDTNLYTVADAKQFVQSTLTVCNRNIAGAAATFRLAVVPAGQSLGNQHYLAYDQAIPARCTKPLTLGFTLNAGDKVIIRASSADLSFSLFGCEIDV